MQNLMQFRRSTRSVILNAMATQYTCSLNGVFPPPLTSTVKSSLFTHVHSSPLSSAARLHQCHANQSRYFNNGWTFSGQTSYILVNIGQAVHLRYVHFIYVNYISTLKCFKGTTK